MGQGTAVTNSAILISAWRREDGNSWHLATPMDDGSRQLMDGSCNYWGEEEKRVVPSF
jgi:hypothetical protein